jgi:uncharacterized YccA/Bax inhibitor family protein
MANPMFNEAALERVGGGTAVLEGPPPPPPTTQDRLGYGGGGTPPSPPVSVTRTGAMTIGGTCSATAVMLAVLVVGAWFGWGRVTETTVERIGGSVTTAHLDSGGLLLAAVFVGLGLAILTSFRPPLARFTALPYALIEGYVVGAVSHLYDVETKGIALQAVIATVGVFAVMLLLYGLRILRATPRFVKGVIAATFGVMAIYVVGLIAQAFGSDLGIFHSTSGISILFSVVVVAIAAFNLIIDFDFVERGTAAGLPRSMEWYGAFGLTVTIVWLYLELLRLLSKLQRR